MEEQQIGHKVHQPKEPVDHIQTGKKRPESFRQILIKMIKTFGAGVLARTCLTLIQNKFNMLKSLKNSKTILRFGIMSACFTFLYRIVRYLVSKLELDLTRDQEVFIASIFSSFALLMAEQSDLRLLKLLIYPRAIEAFSTILVEKGFLKPIDHGENVLLVVSAIIVTYLFIHEAKILEPSMKRNIDTYMNLIPSEKNLTTAFRIIMSNQIRSTYPNSRLTSL